MATKPAQSKALPFLFAITGGVVLVMGLQVPLSVRGWQVADIWRDMLAGTPVNLKAAAVWWMIALAALVIGAVIARPLWLYAPPWRRNRLIRWIFGALLLAGLAHVGHSAGIPEGVSALVYLLASTMVIIIAALMAAIGAIFAMRA